MSNDFGDPNRQYGIPGIDNQTPGSAAQQAGVAAYTQTKKSGGDQDQATQAAVNAAAHSILTNPENTGPSGETAAQALTVAEAKAGTYEPTSAGVSPRLIQQAWAEGILGNKGTPSTSAYQGTAAVPASSQGTATSAASTQGTGSTLASDGQTLADQSAAIQASFKNVYGDMAAEVWAAQHDAAIAGQSAALQAAQQPGSTTTNTINLPAGNTGPSGETAATATGMGISKLGGELSSITSWATANPLWAALGAIAGYKLLFAGGRRR